LRCKVNIGPTEERFKTIGVPLLGAVKDWGVAVGCGVTVVDIRTEVEKCRHCVGVGQN
jgi:hypothetical protein